MTESTAKASPSNRPALVRRPAIDPAALEQFAAGAGKPESVITGTDANPAAPASQAAPAAVPVQAGTKPSHVPYNEKVKPSLFRMTGPQAILLDAVFNRTRYKSKQALYEGEFVTRLKVMAEEFAKTDPEMAAILDSLKDEKSLSPERRT